MAEASRYVKIPIVSLRSWVAGGRFQPLIHPPSAQPLALSFWNLIEAHVLRSLHTDHDVSIKDVRSALTFAEKQLGIERLLLRKELRTDAGRIFLERYGELIDLSASGQLAMRQMLDAHLKRVEWDEWQFPVRLYPFVTANTPSTAMSIAIDPKIAFGRPIVVRAGVSTATIAERIGASETAQDVAADYGLTVEEIEQAVLFERSRWHRDAD